MRLIQLKMKEYPSRWSWIIILILLKYLKIKSKKTKNEFKKFNNKKKISQSKNNKLKINCFEKNQINNHWNNKDNKFFKMKSSWPKLYIELKI